MCCENIKVAGIVSSVDTYLPAPQANVASFLLTETGNCCLRKSPWLPKNAEMLEYLCIRIFICCDGVPAQSSPTKIFFKRKAVLNNFWILLMANLRGTSSRDPDGLFLLSLLLLSHPPDSHAEHTAYISHTSVL